jgi:2-hydroxymethylglutarate dehydrogenase
MKVGFIGIGNMGKSMAKNLLKAGHQLAIYDVNPRPLQELAKMEASVKTKPSEIPPSAEVIFLSLPSHIVVEEVMLGVDGVLSTLKKGQIVVDMTTSLPSVSKKIAEKVAAVGADFLDAPVSGGIQGAAEGTLTIMVGGEASALKKVQGLLEVLGKNIFHIGSHGSGNTMKLVNNLISATNTACFIEGLIFGTKAGLSPTTIYKVITSSKGGNSDVFVNKVPRILDRNFQPTFALDLAYKDLSLAGMLAQELKTPVFLGSVAKELFEMARAKGFGSEDNIALVKVLEELSSVKVTK